MDTSDTCKAGFFDHVEGSSRVQDCFCEVLW